MQQHLYAECHLFPWILHKRIFQHLLVQFMRERNDGHSWSNLAYKKFGHENSDGVIRNYKYKNFVINKYKYYLKYSNFYLKLFTLIRGPKKYSIFYAKDVVDLFVMSFIIKKSQIALELTWRNNFSRFFLLC